MIAKKANYATASPTRIALVAALAVIMTLALAGLGAQEAEATNSSPTLTVTRAATGKLVMKKGSSYKLAAKASSGKITYKSSKSKVVTVNKKGKLRAKKTGKATITVTAKKGSTKVVKKVKVTVVKKSKFKKVKKLTAKASSTTLEVGRTASVTTSFKPKKPSNKNVTFSSSNSSVLSVDAYGTVTAKRAGSATIKVKSCDNAKAKASLKITVQSSNSGETSNNIASTRITVDPIETQTATDSGQYFVSEQVERITGALDGFENVSKLSYTFFARDSYTLSEGELIPAATWAIEPVVLANGYNTLLITAKCKDGKTATAVVYIYAAIENNELDAQLANKDSDEDGLSDWFELNNSGTDPMNSEDGNGDQDGDGLTDVEEQEFESLSHVKDSDGDELDDFDEREAGTNPMNPDTDGDGVTDGKEIQFGTDPLLNDADSVVYVEEIGSIDNDKDISLKVTGAASALQSLKVVAIPEASLISPANIEGMLGQGIAFIMDGNFDSAEVEIDLESEDFDESLSYGLYYINEETAELERVEDQEIRDGRITAVLNHFSNYAVISDDEIVSARKSLKVLFSPGSDSHWDEKDLDGDGFPNSKDPTPYSADTFKTYEDYLRYFFPNTDAASMIVRVPVVGSSQVYGRENGSGHSWMGYWHGTKTGSDKFSELAGFGSTESQAKAVTSLKKGLESWIKMRDRFRLLKTDGSVGDYNYNDNIKGETEGYMSLALPFAVTPDTYQKYVSFIEGYKDLYNLYHNNCTTFMLKAFESMGIESKVTTYVPENVYANDTVLHSLMLNLSDAVDALGERIMSDAGSPGQAGYCIYKYYSYNYVLHDPGYVMRDGSKVGADYGYSSQLSRDLASFRSITDPNQINQEAPEQPVVQATLNGHVYKLYDAGLTWRAAEAWCEDHGGHIVTVTSQEEQGIVEQLLEKGTKNSYWLGGLSTTTGGILWVTNEDDAYTHWTNGQPDDYNGNENAMMIYRSQNPLDNNSGFGLWNDLLEDGTCSSEPFFGLNNFGFIYESDEQTANQFVAIDIASTNTRVGKNPR